MIPHSYYSNNGNLIRNPVAFPVPLLLSLCSFWLMAKVYIIIDLEGFPEKKSKIQVPKSWMSKTVKDVVGLFTKAYNDKNPDTQIDLDNVHVQTEEKAKVYMDEIVRY